MSEAVAHLVGTLIGIMIYVVAMLGVGKLDRYLAARKKRK